MDHKINEIWAGRLLLLLTPLSEYIVFEGITGNLLQIQGEFIVWNLLFYYTIYLLFFGITGSLRISYLSLNLIFTIWAIAEYYVVAFRDRPIMFSDLMAWQTATTVAGNYSYMPTLRMITAVVLMALLSLLIWKFPVRIRRGKKQIALGASVLSWTICWSVCFFTIVVPARSIDVSMWNPAESYGKQGALLCTVRMADYLRVVKPEGYRTAEVQKQYRELEETDSGEGVRPVNIICIMNESWSDLSVIAPFETDEDSFSYYHSLAENCVKGMVYVPVFGALTSNTEYEFLTANSMAFAPSGSVPFQIYMKKHTPSVVESVKDQGYQAIAMHPFPAANWNRTEAYNSLGFDQFLDLGYFADSPELRGYVSDRGAYEKVIGLTEEEEESLFIFLVTMQNHGGYTMEYKPDVHLTDYADMPQTEQYLSLIKESDRALEYLIEYYRQSDEPTLIMMFGDHQPGVEEELYEALYGCELTSLSPRDYLRRYATPFLIWTNYDNNLEEQTEFSAMYLSNQVLKAANLPLNGYQTFLERLKAKVPVIHFMGYTDEQGNWQSWTGWRQKESYEWLRPFEEYQYYRMFDMN